MSPSDPSADLPRGETRHPLEVFFAPRSVAVIGTSEQEGTVGRTILCNLVTNPFGGTVFPIDAKRANVLGIKAWPSVSAAPVEPIRLNATLPTATAATIPGTAAAGTPSESPASGAMSANGNPVKSQ